MWTEELVENPWLLGSPTFGGNPLACSAAIATIKYMLENDIPKQCADKGEFLLKGLHQLAEKYPTVISEVRGAGLMIGLEFVTSDVGYSVAKGMFARRVLTAGTLVNAKCIRFEPAAVISYEDMEQVIIRLDDSLADTKVEFGL
jgi:putrescine aminotransferase